MLHQRADDGIDLLLGVVLIGAQTEVQGYPDKPPRVPPVAGRLGHVAELGQNFPKDLARRRPLLRRELERRSGEGRIEFRVRLRQEARQLPRPLDAAEEPVVRHDHAPEQDRPGVRGQRLAGRLVFPGRRGKRRAQTGMVARVLGSERMSGRAEVLGQRLRLLLECGAALPAREAFWRQVRGK